MNSCSNSVQSDEDLNSNITLENIKNIAKSNNFVVSATSVEDNVLKVNSIEELKKNLQVVNECFKTEMVVGLPNMVSEFSNDKISMIINEKFEKYKSYSNDVMNSNNKGTTENYLSIESDPPTYQYSQTFYFNNTFPCSNVAVTINYSTNSQGQITSADVSSTTYGYSFGNTYQQNYANVNYYGSTIVFQMGAGFTTSVGMGTWTLSNTNNAQYTGYIQLRGGIGGGGMNALAREVLSAAASQREQEMVNE